MCSCFVIINIKQLFYHKQENYEIITNFPGKFSEMYGDKEK